MKLLVLGAGGMLGHKLLQLLPAEYDVTGTVRKSAAFYERYRLFKSECLIGGVDVNDFDTVKKVFSRVQPHFVINCVGVIKQLEAANDPLIAISINSLLPHRLAGLCRATSARLIHISTDCVFSGNKGMYNESDVSDATDLYGRTKFLGEVSGTNCLTLRTSIIGRELESQNGLIEWFLRPDQKEIRGFRRAIYTGLTIIELARVLELVMGASEELTGVYHVSSDPINKYDLLLLARDAFGVSVNIVPADTLAIDRSLDSTQFRKKMNYSPPSWQSMIQELAADKTPYASWHNYM
jgi:dTDP-4-dehydrorhamnose reductase